MTGAQLTVDDAAVLAALDGVIRAGHELLPLQQNLGELLVQRTNRRFDTGTGPFGVPWAPLNPQYAKEKRRGGPLVKTGELAGKVGGLGIVYQIAGDDLLVGTDRPHARVHQFGATIRPKTAAALIFSMGGVTVFADEVTIPARPFLGIDDDDRTEILAEVEDWLDFMAGGVLEASP